MSYIDRLSSIEIQLLKDLPFTPTDAQLVAMARGILMGNLAQAELDGEDLYTAVQNGELPSTYLGVDLVWDVSNPEGDSFSLSLNGITVTQDADDAPGVIIDINDGISDFEAVNLDFSTLYIGLQSNVDLQHVVSNLTFQQSGVNGTVIAWNSSMATIANDGIVTPDQNESGIVTATITKGTQSKVKTFNIDVQYSIIDLDAPSEVTGLSALVSDEEINITWTNPGDVDFDHVEVWYGTGTPTTQFLGTVTNTGTLVEGLTNGSLYTFLLKTVDTTGNISVGTQITATPAETTLSITTDALAMVQAINAEVSVPDTGYVETDANTTLVDSELIVDEILGGI